MEWAAPGRMDPMHRCCRCMPCVAQEESGRIHWLTLVPRHSMCLRYVTAQAEEPFVGRAKAADSHGPGAAPTCSRAAQEPAKECDRGGERGRARTAGSDRAIFSLVPSLSLSFEPVSISRKTEKTSRNASASASTHAIERRPPKKRPPPRPGGKPAARAGSRAVVLRCQAQRWAPRRHASLAVRAPPRSQTKVYPPRPAPPRVPALDCFHRLLPSNAPRPTPCWRRSPVWARSHH